MNFDRREYVADPQGVIDAHIQELYALRTEVQGNPELCSEAAQRATTWLIARVRMIANEYARFNLEPTFVLQRIFVLYNEIRAIKDRADPEYNRAVGRLLGAIEVLESNRLERPVAR